MYFPLHATVTKRGREGKRGGRGNDEASDLAVGEIVVGHAELTLGSLWAYRWGIWAKCFATGSARACQSFRIA